MGGGGGWNTDWQKEKKDTEGGGRRWAGRRRLWTEGEVRGVGGGGHGPAEGGEGTDGVEHWLTQRGEGGSGTLDNTKRRRREWNTG